MNETIIKNWNAAINKNDIVYHLGDIGFPTPQHNVKGQKLIEIINKLNGEIILIKGNHDHTSTIKQIKSKIISYQDELILDINNDLILVLNHYYSSKPNKKYWSLYGHNHTTQTPVNKKYKTINVGVDAWSFSPISLNTIINLISLK
jgi:calcineurin-like phosphoesterase family protein